MDGATRRVGCRLVVSVADPTRLTLQVAVSSARVDERLRVTCAGRRVEAREVAVPGAGRAHVCHLPAGAVEVEYDAVVTGSDPLPIADAADCIVFRRPSRYAESDRLAPVAQAEFAGITDPAELLAAVSSWTGSKLSYVAGSSGPTDGAIDTLLKRRGVCRDYSHLAVALLRALDVPARMVAAYAPGLHPMDFHAVAEAAIDGVWRAVDATLLAPRSSLVRIATGRDAADTTFFSTYGGEAQLLEAHVEATVSGSLPTDDVMSLASIR